MKMKIMRIMLPLITLSVIGMIAVVLVGCLPEEPWDFPDAIIDGDWVYEKIEILDADGNVEKEGARIIGPTKAAREHERLVIPIEIGGLPVLELGKATPAYMYDKSILFNTTKTTKIIIPWQVGFIGETNNIRIHTDSLGTESNIKPKIIYCNYRASDYMKQYASYYIKEHFREDPYRIINENWGHKANIIFNYNFEEAPNSGIYWADDNEIDELIIMPEEPTRDGYDFGGWYTESECINKFDATTKGENDINLFAKWMKIN